ncbi:MAG: inositol-3-phosphate synthase [Acidilobus sp.]
MSNIRLLLVGAGSGASYFAAGLERLRSKEIPPVGIPFLKDLRPYSPEDVMIVGVLDVDTSKVGRDMYEVAKKLVPYDEIPRTLKDVHIDRGLHCGSLKGLPVSALGLDDIIGDPVAAVGELVSMLLKLQPDVVVNVITTEPITYAETEHEFVKLAPTCKLGASMAYAYAVAEYSRKTGKRAAFVNFTPPPIANSPGVVKYFESVGSLVLGDDAATGATPLTADLLEHMAERGRRVLSIAQFNIGGNMDFLSLTEPDRNHSKEITKSSVVADILGYDAPHYIKPTGYLEPLGDRKFVSMHIEYMGFGGFIDEIVVNARINDKSNLAGLIASIVPISKALLDRGASGTHVLANRFFMKMPGPKGTRNVSRIVAYYDLLRDLRRLDLA